jgi:hypothetical protein
LRVSLNDNNKDLFDENRNAYPFIMNERINIFINIYTNDKVIRIHSLGFVLSELVEIEAIEYVTRQTARGKLNPNAAPLPSG